jgi:hypothetical protein
MYGQTPYGHSPYAEYGNQTQMQGQGYRPYAGALPFSAVAHNELDALYDEPEIPAADTQHSMSWENGQRFSNNMRMAQGAANVPLGYGESVSQALR